MINQIIVRKHFQAGCFSAAIILCIIFKLLHSTVIIPDVKGYPYLFNGKHIAWVSIVMCSTFAYWVYNQWQRNHFPRPPQYPGALPLIGHAHQFLGDSLNLWNHAKNIFYYSLKEGGVATVYFGVSRIYVVTDPDDFHTVASACLDKPLLYGFSKTLLGNGIMTADAQTWKIHRKLLSPAFNQQMMNIFLQVFNNQARRLLDQLRPEVGKGTFNPERHLIRNVFENSCQTLLNLNPEDNDVVGTNYTDAIAGFMECLPKRFGNIWTYIPFIYNFTYLKRKQDKCVEVVTSASNKVIRNRKAELLEKDALNITSDKRKLLIDLLIHLAAKENGFTDDHLWSNLNTVLVASYDTTSATLMFALTLLGTHQAVQDRVYEELREVFVDTKEIHIDRHVLSKLAYLEAVLCESMRLYPVAPVIARSVDKAIKLKNYTLEAGSICTLSIYGVCRHPIWGADAEQFRPERWLEPGGVPDNPNAFTNFGLGRRNCIGKQYGMMSMKTMLVHIVSRYRVTADASKLVVRWDPVLRPVSGHDISLELRN